MIGAPARAPDSNTPSRVMKNGIVLPILVPSRIFREFFRHILVPKWLVPTLLAVSPTDFSVSVLPHVFVELKIVLASFDGAGQGMFCKIIG